jgi:small GTP-binding protein
MDDEEIPLYKILLLGDSTVGKTCFLLRFMEDSFIDLHMATIGLDYKLKTMILEEQKIVKVQIWDTAGQDKFRAITRNYYKGASGIILIFDVTNIKSFENIKKWINEIKEEISENVSIVLIGNKIDNVKERKITKEQGEKIANEIGTKFFETSAKTGEGINESVFYLVKIIYENDPEIKKKGQNLKKYKKKKRKFC